MALDRKRFAKEALQLPPQERARLAVQLIASLDQSDDAETERLWLEEAQRRYEAYQAGQIPARSATDALLEVRKSLQ